MITQFLKWLVALMLGTAATVVVVGLGLLSSAIGAVIGTISLGSGILLLVAYALKEWWDAKT